MVEIVLDAGNLLGEGPVWDGASQALWWTDILDCALHRFTPADGAHERVGVDRPVGSFALGGNGALILATDAGFASLDVARGTTRVMHGCVSPPLRMNDGKCDPAGRFWAGTNGSAQDDPPGALYVLDTDGAVRTAVEPVRVSNGIGWSPDATTMYYIDSARRTLDAFHYDGDGGTVGGRRTVVTFDGRDGWPDGMTVDADGGLWVAMWRGGKIKRFRPDGTFDDEIAVPTPNPTSCAFGGPDLRDLYITSARSRDGGRGRPLHESPAGALFRARPGVTGLPMHRYGAS